ncbi:OXA1L mitochondrial inner membrane protein isoform X2 [Andrena cerasifolii]|uniref:OXA1L mitochondrial inner membrane protein isoform X2 n=1 Tax=Andrena cerasifolii TaxID=2819439 RepID=UPI0040379368
MLSRLSINVGRTLLVNINLRSQKIGKCKFSRLACSTLNVSSRDQYAFSIHKHSKFLGIYSVRHQSTVDAPRMNETVISTPKDPPVAQIQDAVKSTSETGAERFLISELPDPPTPPTPEIAEVLVHTNGEPTLASIGLGGYTPSGLIQSCLEWLHIGCDMPWWSTIVAGTVCVRLLIFPLVIIAQRNAANMTNNMPEMQKIQVKMTAARQCGNEIEAAICAQDLMKFMKEKELNPMKSLIVATAQVPIFISFFVALKQMANVPVESLRTGGLWWFTDLTIPDPYYILPIITSLTMYTTIEMAMLTSGSMGNLGLGKYVFKAIPVIMLPFILNFPGVILCYWVSTNFISLLQVGVLKTQRLRNLFNIPALIKHKTEELPLEPKGFVHGLNESWTNVKISKKLQDKKYADSMQFNRAGKGPLQKTFRYDPTKNQRTAATAILTKKR